MRDLFTRGKGPYGKVYEKLRKWSLRDRDHHIALGYDRDDEDSMHQAFVYGVRRALAEVERLRSS